MIKEAITRLVNKLRCPILQKQYGVYKQRIINKPTKPKKIILKDVFREDGWKLSQPFGFTEYAEELEEDYLKGKYENRVYPHIQHIGLDWSGKVKGFPIRATLTGQIMWAGKNDRKKARGKYISLWDMQQEVASIDLHMNEVLVKKGQFVNAGDILGTVGDTGWTDGVHDHYGLYKTKDGYIINKDNGAGGAIDPSNKKLVKWVK